MNCRFVLIFICIIILPFDIIYAQIIETYKETPTRDLKLKIFKPENISSDKTYPSIVFFFGGGWKSRNLSQFERHAKRLAKKGMICFIVDYRVYNTDEVSPDICLMDAKSAMRYINKNAERLKVDISKLVAAGGSAGGHLAAATRYIESFNDPNDDLDINCKPTALVLFNPVIDNSNEGYGYDRIKKFYPEFSPLQNIKKPVPTIFFVGSEDKLIPPVTAKKYQDKCKEEGGRCDLHIFENKGHGFFNNNDDYIKTMELTEKFLESIGYIN